MLAHQILYGHPPRYPVAPQPPGPAGRLWRDGVARRVAPPGKRYVHLSDRAGDITEMLDDADQHGRSHVTRSPHDRYCRVDARIVKLHASARTCEPMGEVRLIEVASQKGKPARAAVQMGWKMVTLQPPAHVRGRERGVPLVVWVVRVWEPAPPAGVEPIDGLLLTNVAVSGAEDAWERVGWYACRMVVEEYHKGMKTG